MKSEKVAACVRAMNARRREAEIRWKGVLPEDVPKYIVWHQAEWEREQFVKHRVEQGATNKDIQTEFNVGYQGAHRLIWKARNNTDAWSCPIIRWMLWDECGITYEMWKARHRP